MLRQRYALWSVLWRQRLHCGYQCRVACAPRRIFGALTTGVARINAGDVQGHGQRVASCLRMADKILSCSLQAVVNVDGAHLAGVKTRANMQQRARISAAAIGHSDGQRHLRCSDCSFELGCA